MVGAKALPVYSNPSDSEPWGVMPSEVTGLVMVMSEYPGMLAGTVTVNDVALFRVTPVAA